MLLFELETVFRKYSLAPGNTGVVVEIKVSGKLPPLLSDDFSSAGDSAASQPGDLQPFVQRLGMSA